MNSLDFISTARTLARHSGPGRPLETNLRRAVSTAYYALFHCLAECCADMMVGGPGADRDRDAWRQVYRALQHRTARDRCRQQNTIAKFSPEIRNFATTFAQMQDLRHSADYDPDAAPLPRSEVIKHIDNSESVIRQFPYAQLKDRRAFAVHVLMDARRA